MRVKIHTFKVKCDRCDKTEVVSAQYESDALPKGWGTFTSGGWGMTDYTRTEDLCPKCLPKKSSG